MGEALSYWLDATRAQGDPSRWTKTDVEIGAMRVFDKFKFNAGKSQRERRRAFEEVWEASCSDPGAVAFGFDEALKRRKYSIAYVKMCARNMNLSPPAARTAAEIGAMKPEPIVVRHTAPVVDVPKEPTKAPARAPRKKKNPNVAEPEVVDCGI